MVMCTVTVWCVVACESWLVVVVAQARCGTERRSTDGVSEILR
jgi:hypothetical protein